MFPKTRQLKRPSLMHETETLYERIGGSNTIALLLKHFYADVRQHQVIGPIFDSRIQNWPEHLAKIGEFWARVTGGPSSYSGQMPMKHLALGLSPEHFGIWLQLWDANCHCYLKPREARELSDLAHEIGARLKTIISAQGSSPAAFAPLSFAVKKSA
jgi:hemoglobin